MMFNDEKYNKYKILYVSEHKRTQKNYWIWRSSPTVYW